jgi:hypothetical protein
MKGALKAGAIVLLTLGLLAVVYGGFTYTRERHTANLGALELTVKDQQRVNIPLWAGVVALVGGAALLLGARQKY